MEGKKVYDYVFIGRGLSASSIIAEMTESSFFGKMSILILDPKTYHPIQNWSFRADSNLIATIPIPLKTRTTSKICQGGESILSNYTQSMYCSISSTDWWEYIDKKIRESTLQIVHLNKKTTNVYKNTDGTITIQTEEGNYVGHHVFNSNISFNSILKPWDISLHQKFFGLVIHCENAVFSTNTVTLMDFQSDGNHICFIYTLPYSSNHGLVEYTYFDDNPLIDIEYIKNKLIQHLQSFGPYTILQEESGNIPMTSMKFRNNSLEGNVRHIGTAGGATKPSSGYTFLNILRDTKEIIKNLQTLNPIRPQTVSKRHRWYDTIMLQIMKSSPLSYPLYIKKLFNHTPVNVLLDFMNENSSIIQELRVIKSLPKMPFIHAFFIVTIRKCKIIITSFFRA